MLWLTKAGADKAEYEDAWYAPAGRASAAGGYTLAVADGASESMLAGAWAGRLVESVGALAGQDIDEGVLAERICSAAARWPSRVKRYVRRRERAGRPLAWYEESKLEQGAYAALLGISLRCVAGSGAVHDGGGTWTAAALGDVCGFQVRGTSLLAAFPLTSSAQFNTSPHLAGTRGIDRELVMKRTVARHGTWQPQDVFYLATDAAAQWFLAEAEAGRRPWHQLDAVMDEPEPGPQAWLDALRAERGIRNDDVTVLRCRPRALEPAQRAD